MATAKPGNAKRQISMPHVYTLIVFLMVAVAVLTWIIPSGSFDRQDVQIGSSTRSVTIAGTYQTVDKVSDDGDLRQGFFDVITAPTRGIQAAVDVVAFVLIVGGAFQIITKTQAIAVGMRALIRLLRDKDIVVIPISMALFSLGGSTIGMSEETLPFFAIFVPIMLSMGFDSMVAFMIVFVGASIGYMASTINPFNVLIAQGIIGIQGNPQLWLRGIAWVVMTAAAIVWVMLYARRVRSNPKSSIVYASDLAKQTGSVSQEGGEVEFSVRQRIVLCIFGIGLAAIVWGLITQGWYMDEISGVFFLTGIAAGVVSGMNEHEIASEFVNGMADFAYSAVVIGFARAILVLMQDGQIIDTILNALARALAGTPAVVYVAAMFVVLMILAFFVPSSSGLAALTMPILGPLTELMGMNPEAAVTALTFASKIVTMVNPLSAITVAGLAICGITLDQWFKTFWKFMLVCIVAGIAFSTISGLIPVF